jgi:hypothetical protein
MHQQHAADALLLVLDEFRYADALDERARIDAAEGERADERVVHDLERQHRERLVVGRLALDFGFGLRSMPLIAGMSSGDGR